MNNVAAVLIAITIASQIACARQSTPLSYEAEYASSLASADARVPDLSVTLGSLGDADIIETPVEFADDDSDVLISISLPAAEDGAALAAPTEPVVTVCSLSFDGFGEGSEVLQHFRLSDVVVSPSAPTRDLAVKKRAGVTIAAVSVQCLPRSRG